MAAPVVTKIRVNYVRIRPRDTIGALPVVIVIGEAPPGPPTTTPGYVHVYLTRRKLSRGRQPLFFLRRPGVVLAAQQPPTFKIRVSLVRTRPRQTRFRVGPPRVVTVPTPVLSRNVRARVTLTRIRPRRTSWHVVKPVIVGPPAPPPPAPVPATRIQTTLGCGKYTAYVTMRGGTVFVGEIPWTSLSYSRALDDTSSATIQGEVGKCSDVFTAAMPWTHELAIMRSGDLVWCGPIITVTGDPNTPSIAARDLSAWWDHRVVHQTHDYQENGADLAVIFQAIHEDAMQPDNSPGLVLETTPVGVVGNQQVFSDQRQMAGPFLRDLAQAGIDWTIVARTAHAGGPIIPGTRIGAILHDDHFVMPPTPIRDGSAQGNKEYMQGQGTDDSGFPVEGIAQDADLQVTDGLLETVESNSNVFDNKTALASAQSKLDLNKRPVTIGDGVLSPDAPILMSDLVPGRMITVVLDSTIIRVQGQYRLFGVSVQADYSGGEQVTITLQVPGTGAG